MPSKCSILCLSERHDDVDEDEDMALNVHSPSLSPLSSPRISRQSSTTASSIYLLLLSRWSSSFSATNRCQLLPSSSPATMRCSRAVMRASGSERDDGTGATENSSPSLLSDGLLRRVSGLKDADQALEVIGEALGSAGGGVLETADCHSIIEAAFGRDNPELALSVFQAMKWSSSQDIVEKFSSYERWTWDKPDIRTYGIMVRGLAASLRVSEAIRMISYVTRMGFSYGDEVPFGMVVCCPSCMIAIAVVQPQHGVQVASCSQCRYQYELVSGNILSIASEEISMDISAWEKALRFLQRKKESIPAAVHSVVVCTPSGSARTYKFTTGTVELPAQEGERVTISVAAPSNIYREKGPLKLSARSPQLNPAEPMCLTNHTNGQMTRLLRVPVKVGKSLLLEPFVLIPSLAVIASGDAISSFIDPSLPRLVSLAAATSIVLGTALNRVILPELCKLPQKMVDALAVKQQLLYQYDLLQTRIKDLRQATEREVWMLARMSQLEKKIVAVGEPSYRARRTRVKKVRESLESSLVARIELIESYTKISSMIEIEVEMDSNVPAAEAVNNAESIAEQIQQIMEIENLEERWRIQAEANDEVERLLSSEPVSTEFV